MSDYQVTLVNNKMSEFFVKFHGPVESGSIDSVDPLSYTPYAFALASHLHAGLRTSNWMLFPILKQR
jgi:hypothetical protein